MSNPLQQDLALFNTIVEELLNEEEKNPVAPLINVEELYDKLDFRLSNEACIDEEFAKSLKETGAKNAKNHYNRFFNQL